MQLHVVEDYGKRMSDIVNSHIVFTQPWELRNKCMAFRLRDGSSDNVLYDNKRDAVRHQKGGEYECAYFFFRNCLAGITPLEATIFMNYNRMVYDGGGRLPDPDDVHGGPDAFMDVMTFDKWTGRHARAIRPN